MSADDATLMILMVTSAAQDAKLPAATPTTVLLRLLVLLIVFRGRLADRTATVALLHCGGCRALLLWEGGSRHLGDGQDGG